MSKLKCLKPFYLETPTCNDEISQTKVFLISDDCIQVGVPLLNMIVASGVVRASMEGLCLCQDVKISVPGFRRQVLEMLPDFLLGKEISMSFNDMIVLTELCSVLGLKCQIHSLERKENQIISQIDDDTTALECESLLQQQDKKEKCLSVAEMEWQSGDRGEYSPIYVTNADHAEASNDLFPHQEPVQLFSDQIANAASTNNCHNCDRAFKRKCDLTRHLALCPKQTIPSEQCPPKGETVESNADLTPKVELTDNVKLKKTSDVLAPNLESVNSCFNCNRAFQRKCDLTRHVVLCANRSRYICQVCQEDFQTERDLNRHMRIHLLGKRYPCDVCSRSFARFGNLQTHMSSHAIRKRYPCSVCGKIYVLRRYLNRHMLVHTGERPYKCNVCSMSFLQSEALTGHLKIHAGIKPFKCDECGRSFRLKFDLGRHCMSHTGEMPHVCKVCKARFTFKRSLTTHMKDHHS